MDFSNWKNYLKSFVSDESFKLFNEIKKEQREKTLIMSSEKELEKEEKDRIKEIDSNFEMNSKKIRETENELVWKSAINVIESTSAGCLVRYKNEFEKIPFSNRMPNKNFRIFNLFLSFLYDKGAEEWFIPLNWIKRILNFEKLGKGEINELKNCFPYIEKDGKKIFLFETHWKTGKVNGQKKGEFVHLIYNKAFDIYFRDIKSNFVFYNIEEINNCKTLEEIKFFLYLRKKSWCEKIGGNTMSLTLDEFAKIVGIKEGTKKDTIKRKFESCLESIDERYSIKATSVRKEKEIFAKNYSEKYEITFTTNVDGVSIGKLEEDNRKLENEENLFLLKMIFNKDFSEENSEKIQILKTEKEERILHNKNLSKTSKKRLKKSSKKKAILNKVEKENVKTENEKKDKVKENDTLEMKKMTKEEIEKPYVANGVRTKINFTELEKRNLAGIKELEDGRELGILNGTKLPKGCDRTKFAVPEDIKSELKYVINSLKSISNEILEVSIKSGSLDDFDIQPEIVDEMSIDDAIIFIDEHFKDVAVEKDRKEDKARRRAFSLFYNYFEGTINSEVFINEIKNSIKRNWERLSEGSKEWLSIKAGKEYKVTKEETESDEKLKSLEIIEDDEKENNLVSAQNKNISIEENEKKNFISENSEICYTEKTEEKLLENRFVNTEKFINDEGEILELENKLFEKIEETSLLNENDWICGEIDFINETKRIKEIYADYKNSFRYLINNKMNLSEETLKQELEDKLNNYKDLLICLSKHIANMKKEIEETEEKYSNESFPF